jgi:hypothetical protein
MSGEVTEDDQAIEFGAVEEELLRAFGAEEDMDDLD